MLICGFLSCVCVCVCRAMPVSVTHTQQMSDIKYKSSVGTVNYNLVQPPVALGWLSHHRTVFCLMKDTNCGLCALVRQCRVTNVHARTRGRWMRVTESTVQYSAIEQHYAFEMCEYATRQSSNCSSKFNRFRFHHTHSRMKCVGKLSQYRIEYFYGWQTEMN